NEKARQLGFAVEITNVGVSLIPVVNGRQLSTEEYGELDADLRDQIEGRRNTLEEDVAAFMRSAREVNKLHRESLKNLNRQVGSYVVGGKLAEIKTAFAEYAAVTRCLDDVRDQILTHLGDFTSEAEPQESGEPQSLKLEAPVDRFVKYQVNVVVDNTGTEGAP